MKSLTDYPYYLRQSEVCQITGLHRHTLHKLDKCGKLPSIRLTGLSQKRWKREQVALWLQGNQSEP